MTALDLNHQLSDTTPKTTSILVDVATIARLKIWAIKYDTNVSNLIKELARQSDKLDHLLEVAAR